MTTWAERNEVSTNRTPRKTPSIYIAPLEGVNGIVHDEEDEVIYIISNTGKEVPFTQWEARPILPD